MWRKNRAPTFDRKCTGVDLNRNYGYAWLSESIEFLHLCDNIYDCEYVFWWNKKTRMHSSRMRTVRCSRRMLGLGVLPRGWVSAQGGVCPGVSAIQPRELNDRRLWKHYLAVTTLRTVIMPVVTISSEIIGHNREKNSPPPHTNYLTSELNYYFQSARTHPKKNTALILRNLARRCMVDLNLSLSLKAKP